MPFTLAHPVAMLPFARRRVHFPAMVIGSLAPDFVYFLHGRAVPGGHSLANLLWPNLPLCFAIYALYTARRRPHRSAKTVQQKSLFMGRLHPADVLRLGTLANRCPRTAGPCRYANNPPHRLRRAQIITTLHSALLSGIANALLFSYCVGSSCCTFVLSTAHGLVGEDVASAIA